MYPLVVVLHGYSVNGFIQESYFNAKSLVTDDQAFVIAPDGLVDSMGHQYWNADPACCDFDHANPDDVGYLSGLIKDIKAAWPIDRVLVMGHSNGGYMTYRLTCDHADLVDGMVVLAGAYPTTACAPSRPVSLIHIHGDQDAEVPFSLAMPSVTSWAANDGCGAFSPGPAYDLDGVVAGSETTSQIASCPAGLDVEFWTMAGVGHIPSYTAAFMPTIWGWFTSH
jgi:polyhydroxybutyrate depolymerase